MNYVSKHSRDHADSEYVLNVWVDCKGAEFIVTNKHTNTQLSTLVESFENFTAQCMSKLIMLS